MTTELTLREKVRATLQPVYKEGYTFLTLDNVIDRIADLLSATGAPAYIRVADDLRGEWVEGECGE